MKMRSSEELAQHLVEFQVIKLDFEEGFTYTSGRKGPIYTDLRKIWSYPELREILLRESVKYLTDKGPFDAIVGVATGGIPLGMLLADRLKLPFLYVRSKAKAHGKKQAIEGDLTHVRSVLLVEDLVNSGKSVGEALLHLEESSVKAQSIFSLVNYQTSNFYRTKESFQRCFHHWGQLVERDDLMRALKLDESKREKILQALK